MIPSEPEEFEAVSGRVAEKFEAVSGQVGGGGLTGGIFRVAPCLDQMVFCVTSGTLPTPEGLEITDVADFDKFRALAKEWIVERGASSSVTKNATCEAYQKIIGMGERALRPIFRQLESEGDDPDQWFWALKMITGTDPVSPVDRGNYLRMARTWLEWAKREGYVK